MRARGLLVPALIAAFGASAPLSAQSGSIGTRSPAPSGARPGGAPPAPRGAAGPIRRPVGTITTVPALRGGYAHRACIFRSPIFGFLVFDPYWWVAPDVVDENPSLLPPPPLPGPQLMGGLQLDVEPRRALVYFDGVLIGTVDQFKGYFQHLEAAAGHHIVEFISPDYEPLVTEVTVVPNKTTTYRASLSRAGGR
jgi:hypothetical protein